MSHSETIGLVVSQVDAFATTTTAMIENLHHCLSILDQSHFSDDWNPIQDYCRMYSSLYDSFLHMTQYEHLSLESSHLKDLRTSPSEHLDSLESRCIHRLFLHLSSYAYSDGVMLSLLPRMRASGSSEGRVFPNDVMTRYRLLTIIAAIQMKSTTTAYQEIMMFLQNEYPFTIPIMLDGSEVVDGDDEQHIISLWYQTLGKKLATMITKIHHSTSISQVRSIRISLLFFTNMLIRGGLIGEPYTIDMPMFDGELRDQIPPSEAPWVPCHITTLLIKLIQRYS